MKKVVSRKICELILLLQTSTIKNNVNTELPVPGLQFSTLIAQNIEKGVLIHSQDTSEEH